MFVRVFFFFSFFSIFLFASYEDGKKIFKKHCASCHLEYIPMKTLKINFYEKNNTLLNLRAPTVNMLSYALLRGPKHLGSKEDKEMQQIEIEEFLSDYLSNPNPQNSICDPYISKHYNKKMKMKKALNEEELSALALYFMNFDRSFKGKIKKNKKTLASYTKEVNLAKKQKKHLLVYAHSHTCYFCKKMEKNIFSLSSIKNAIKEDYVFIKINVDKNILPFSLQEKYKGITPTFFILNNKKEVLNKYPGSWSKKDFLDILKESL